MSQHEFTGAVSEKGREATTGKPVGRMARTADLLFLVRTCMRILVQLESDPVSLEACMSELRVLELKLNG